MSAPEITLHEITAITVAEVRHDTLQNGTDYYSRRLVIKGKNGAIMTLQMFSDDGYALLVHDNDLRQIQEPLEAD